MNPIFAQSDVRGMTIIQNEEDCSESCPAAGELCAGPIRTRTDRVRAGIHAGIYAFRPEKSLPGKHTVTDIAWRVYHLHQFLSNPFGLCSDFVGYKRRCLRLCRNYRGHSGNLYDLTPKSGKSVLDNDNAVLWRCLLFPANKLLSGKIKAVIAALF